MTGRADPRGAMDADAVVAALVHVRLGRVDAHPHPDHDVRRTRSSRRARCALSGSRDGVAGSLEGHEEAVARRVDLVALVIHESSSRIVRWCSARRLPEVSPETPCKLG